MVDSNKYECQNKMVVVQKICYLWKKLRSVLTAYKIELWEGLIRQVNQILISFITIKCDKTQLYASLTNNIFICRRIYSTLVGDFGFVSEWVMSVGSFDIQLWE